MLQFAIREKHLDEPNVAAIVDMIAEQGVDADEAQAAVHCIIIACRPNSS